jgi:putative transposase
LFARLGLNTRPDGTPPQAFGRFEAVKANDRWTGDALHGPVVAGRKAYLFAFVDDHSRAVPGYRWGHSEDTIRLEAALRHGLGSRGVPRSIYLDYADLRVMPTWGAAASVAGACGLRMSA